MEKFDVVIRPAVKEDKNFILASWLRCYRSSSYFCRRIRKNVFFKYHHVIADRILSHATVLIAADPTDANVIYGYLISEFYEPDQKHVVHFIYIKEAFREMGIAKQLFTAAGLEPNSVLISHWTEPVDKLILKYPDMIYIPYLI